MCYSKAEGGQRCFGHAHARYLKATAAYNGDPMSDAALENLMTAQIEYASTKQGEANLIAQYHQAVQDDDEDLAEFLGGTITRGREMREKNAAVRAAVLGKPVAEARHADDIAFGANDPAEVGARLAATGQSLGPTPPTGAVPDEDGDRSTMARWMAAQKEAAFEAAYASGDLPADPDLHAEYATYRQGRDEAYWAEAAARAARIETFKAAHAAGTMPEDQSVHGQYLIWQEREQADERRKQAARQKILTDRAEKVLAEHAAALPEHQRIEAVHAVWNLANPDLTPKLVERHAQSIATAFHASPFLTARQKEQWTEDLVRDLSGINVKVSGPSLFRREVRVEAVA